jgi:FxsC-like protein
MGTPEPPRSGFAFYLSYAHVPPASEGSSVEDAAVPGFFEDLSRAVAQAGGPRSTSSAGFFDGTVPGGRDLPAAVARALSESQILVPLISPRYLQTGWSRSEYQAFQDRLDRIRADSVGHIQPVLWIPLPPGERHPDWVRPAEGYPDTPDYPANGLRMLRTLSIYRPQYETIVGRLAHRIVDVAQNSPIGPSTVAPLRPPTDVGPVQFGVSVLAPTTSTLPPDRRPDVYGPSAADWRPFADGSEVPIAQHASSVAERLGLSTAVVPAADLGERYRDTPALLLIDPWILAAADGRSQLERSLRGLPDWMTPMAVCDDNDPQYAERGRALFEEAVDMIADTVPHRRPRDARGAREADDALPHLVSQTRGRFLRGRPVTTPTRRPRLSDAYPSDPGAGAR